MEPQTHGSSVSDHCQQSDYLSAIYSVSMKYNWKVLCCTELKSVSLWFLSIDFYSGPLNQEQPNPSSAGKL